MSYNTAAAIKCNQVHLLKYCTYEQLWDTRTLFSISISRYFILPLYCIYLITFVTSYLVDCDCVGAMVAHFRFDSDNRKNAEIPDQIIVQVDNGK